MISFIKKKLERAKLKRTFQEYGYKLKEFSLKEYGNVQYAQWLHPFESEKEITQAQIDFYAQFIQKGDFLIDIGAHTGDTTVPMAVATGKQGKILALEPNPYVFKILEKNSTLNKDAGFIIPLRKAATLEEGIFTFNYSDASFCNGGYLEKIKNNRHNHNYSLEVEGINLQEYLLTNHSADLNQLSLLKVDAEGYDKEILKTIPRILEEYQPVILVECYKRLNEEERIDLYQTITSLGYQLFKIASFKRDTAYLPLTENKMNDERHFEMLAIPSGKEQLLKRLAR
jgi:FkbM family methyltransferase